MPKKTATKRSEVVTVRLDPRLKYLAEIAARKQRRPLSGYIEWAVEQSLLTAPIRDLHDGSVTVWEADREAALWDVDESVRVARMALRFPDLLTYQEQLVWRVVRYCGAVWLGHCATGEFTWKVVEKSVRWDLLREHWETFKKVATGELSEGALPSWQRYPDKPSLDDEIPF